jgi:GNAT superfamily N-acetyltransferase
VIFKNMRHHIRSFAPADQAPARALILRGMAEHWGFVDESLNPDLNDIAANYADDVFLVATQERPERSNRSGRLEIIATGALKIRAADTGEIVRMSVAHEMRREGIGSAILKELLAQAWARGLGRVVLETNASWAEVVAFYVRNGFAITHYVDGEFGREVWMEIRPGKTPAPDALALER